MKTKAQKAEDQKFVDSIIYDPSVVKVLGVKGNRVHVIGASGEYSNPIILMIDREEFVRTQSVWLDHNLRLCNHTDKYLELLGHFTIEIGNMENYYLDYYDHRERTQNAFVISVDKFSKDANYVIDHWMNDHLADVNM